MNLIPGVIDLLDEIEWASVRNELPVVSFATGAAYHKGLRLSTSDFGIRHKTAGRLTRYLIKAPGFDCIVGAGSMIRKDTAEGLVYIGVPAQAIPGKTSFDVKF